MLYMYNTWNWFYEKKIIFFKILFCFLDTRYTQKDFFCTAGPKITYFYILGGQHVYLTPKKCFLEAYSTKCP